jgi:hypothetical protein
MSKKNLRTLTHPQVWLGKPSKGMVECVILENFGDGPLAARLWVPCKEVLDTAEHIKVIERVRKRLKQDNGILLEHYSGLASHKHPLKEEV